MVFILGAHLCSSCDQVLNILIEYHAFLLVHEKEKLRGRDPDDEEAPFGEYTRT